MMYSMYAKKKNKSWEPRIFSSDTSDTSDVHQEKFPSA